VRPFPEHVIASLSLALVDLAFLTPRGKRKPLFPCLPLHEYRGMEEENECIQAWREF
jgi:hypothetical protein